MRRLGVIPLLLALCAWGGCQTKPVKPPEVVTVPVDRFVPIPRELTEPCKEVPKKDNTTGEAVRLANARKASLEECSGRMSKIRGLQP